MALITVTNDTIIADLVVLLNSNFAYLEGLAGVAKYVATLSTVTGQQTITHNLNDSDVVVSIWDSSGNQVFADTLIFSANVVKVTFEAEFSGKVVVIA